MAKDWGKPDSYGGAFRVAGGQGVGGVGSRGSFSVSEGGDSIGEREVEGTVTWGLRTCWVFAVVARKERDR